MRRLPIIGSVFLLLSVLLCGSACLMVPNLAKRLDEERVTDRLQIGVSKRRDVRKLLGTPKSATEHAWIHEWHTKKGWLVVGYQGGVAPMGTRGYRTLTVFDDAGTLRGLELRAESKRSDIAAEDEPTPIRSLDLPGCRALKACSDVTLSRYGRLAAGPWGIGTLCLWDLEVLETKHTWHRPRFASGFIINPAGDRVAAPAKRGVLVWMPGETEEKTLSVPDLSRRPLEVAFSSDGSRIAVVGGKSLRVYDVDPWRERLAVEILKEITNVEFSPDDLMLAVLEQDGDVTLVAAETGAKLGSSRTGYLGGCHPEVAFSPDGTRLALNHRSHVVILATEAMLDGIPEEPEVVLLPFGGGRQVGVGWPDPMRCRSGIAFSETGSLLATVSDRGTSVWHMPESSLRAVFPHQKTRVSDIAFSENGESLLVAGENSVHEWELLQATESSKRARPSREWSRAKGVQRK